MKLAFLIDPLASLKPSKDTSLHLAHHALAMGHDVYIFTLDDIQTNNQGPAASLQALTEQDSYVFSTEATETSIKDMDYVFMRKDPPFDMEYLYACYWLESLAQTGVKIINPPRALRDANEKLFASWFPELCPPFVVSRNPQYHREFLQRHGESVIKPLDGMGGQGIFHLRTGDSNLSSILETLGQSGSITLMSQTYLPEIKEGDKRILILNGKVIDHCLARIPAQGELRGNLAAGGSGVVQALTDSDFHIANTVAAKLEKMGILIAGIDVIGSHLTEVNITSPTCLREIEDATGQSISTDFLNALEKNLH